MRSVRTLDLTGRVLRKEAHSADRPETLGHSLMNRWVVAREIEWHARDKIM